MDLSQVDWGAVSQEFAEEVRRSNAPRARRRLAAVSSLRARFADDYGLSTAASTMAIRLEPLEPLHHVRDALARLRFGDNAGAVARVEALPEGVRDLPLVLVVKGMAAVQRGEPRVARNIADRALQVDPGHVAARFLHADATLQAATKGGLDKLAQLPHGPELEPAWADVLGRLALARPGDRRAVFAALDRGVLTRGGAADAILRKVLAWSDPALSLDDLEEEALRQAPGSRAEELTVTLFTARVAAGEPDDATRRLRALGTRHTERPSFRRAMVAALTRLAIIAAGHDRLVEALRLVEACRQLEPFEPVHHQNRAALFTLAGEHDAALDAWADLDRLHYRLALLGRLDRASVARYAAPHRMFAVSARLTRGARTGVFVVERQTRGGVTSSSLAVNQEALDRDPEQLRHWLHHGRAALVFEFVALGTERDRLLLAPASPAEADARVAGLCALTQSLSVLVPDEGRRLAELLIARFRDAGEAPRLRYVDVELPADVRYVQRRALELYAELALLCYQWEPAPARRAIVDEIVDTVRALGPFCDDRALTTLVKAASEDAPASALDFLARVMRSALDLEGDHPPLDGAKRTRLAGAIAATLRVRLVDRYRADAEHLSDGDVEHLLEQLDLARRDNPREPWLEFVAARLLVEGDYLDEAGDAIRQYHRLAGDRRPELSAQVEKLQEIVDRRRADGHGRRTRDGTTAVPRVQAVDPSVAELEAELEEQPTSIALYTELCHQLARAGRWTDAHAWAGRAIARCLSSTGQTRARELALTLSGLEPLAAVDPDAVAGYTAGALAQALPALERVPSAPSPGLSYVRGRCLLALDRREEAQRAFAEAVERCDRAMYLVVLRPLATDIERAAFDAAKQEIDEACADGRYADAFGRVAERMATVSRPAPYVIELARIQLAAYLPTVGVDREPDAPPPVRVDAPWQGELAAALATREPVARTRALVELACAVHEPSSRQAQALSRRLDELEAQLASLRRLDESIHRARAGDDEGALAVLAELGAAADRYPRILRQRTILLLRLGRYAQADAVATQLDGLADSVAREVVARYPALRARHQLAAASALVRVRDFAAARTLLDETTAADADQEIEVAYCRACCAAAEGYAADGRGERGEASRHLYEGLRAIEACLGAARRAGHQRALELHAKLEQDVERLEGARA